ncbi:MAG: leucine-rich repeat domain-containing protein, partial [Muribaculaceae bacterium]|nr:leucine-rich repeat domain-containing protein [Muribaculaceae bacterium]
LPSVVIATSGETIGDYTFSDCSRLTSVIIPNSVTSIGSSAFSGCNGLIKSAYPNTIKNPFPKGTCISYPADGANIEGGFVYGPDKSAIYFAPLTLEGEFTIPSSVQFIGSYAFYGCSGLTSVDIPNSVTSIGSSAFSGCSGLTSLTVADGEATLAFEKDALKDAPIETLYMGRDWSYTETAAISTGLKSVTIGNQVKSIPNYAFYNCTGITSVEIPNSVQTIGSDAFNGCSGLTSVKVGWEKPLAISENVFSNDTYEGATLHIPDNTILDYLATNWGKFSNMSVDGAATKIFSDNVFRYRLVENAAHDAVLISGDYSSMTEANIPERFTDDSDPANPVRYIVKAIGPNAFKGCSKLESVIFNSRSKLTAIGEASFSGCTGLTSMAMPAELTAINANAFENCTGMTDVKLNDKLATIGESAFYNCKSLSEISIPASVKEIGGSAFGECAGLEKAEFASIEDLCKIEFGNLSANPLNNISLLYIEGEEVTEVVIPDGIETLRYTFAGCADIYSVVIPNSVETIGDYAFYNCGALRVTDIPTSVNAIGDYAFYKNRFEKITIPSSVQSIGRNAFNGNSCLLYTYPSQRDAHESSMP